MTRTTQSWTGKTDDSMPPPMVRLRIFEAYGGCCYLCTRKISAGDTWDLDHTKPLWDGGENVEDNLAPACAGCHRGKTAEEASERAEGKRHRAKAAGIKAKVRNPVPGSKASRWKKLLDGTVVRR